MTGLCTALSPLAARAAGGPPPTGARQARTAPLAPGLCRAIELLWRPLRPLAKAVHYQASRMTDDGVAADVAMLYGVCDMPQHQLFVDCGSRCLQVRKGALRQLTGHASLATVYRFLDECQHTPSHNPVTCRALALILNRVLGPQHSTSQEALRCIRLQLLHVHPDKLRRLNLDRLQHFGAADYCALLLQLRDVLQDPAYGPVLYTASWLDYGQLPMHHVGVRGVFEGLRLGLSFLRRRL